MSISAHSLSAAGANTSAGGGVNSRFAFKGKWGAFETKSILQSLRRPSPIRDALLAWSCIVVAGCDSSTSGDDGARLRTHALALVEEVGAHVLANVDRVVAPAIERSKQLAVDQRSATALRAGDQRALTTLANEAVLQSGAVDVVAFFDVNGEVIAISNVYADGRPVPAQRVERVVGRDFATRPIVMGCLSNDATHSILEFQTECDITPAYFDSSGLSVAYSTPVRDRSTGEKLGLVSACLEFPRVQELLHDGALASRRQSLHFVTDDGRYFSEEYARGGTPPIPTDHLASIIAPVARKQVHRAHADVEVDGKEARVTVLPLVGFETLDGGGLNLILIADREWIDAELMFDDLTRRVLWGATVALTGVLVCAAFLFQYERRRRLELARARDAALASERAKAAFVAHMSHEIRTPLTAVLGFSEAIAHSTDLAETKEHGATILRSGKSLLAILDDVLDLSKIEAGGIEARLEPCSPRAIVQDVVGLFEMRSREKGIPVEVEYAPDLAEFVQTDALRVRQILANLVSNALKFTLSGTVRVSTATHAVDAEHVELVIAVTDTGIGIAPQDQERLFQPFVQIDTGATRRFGGTGLGLTISRRFAEILKGALELESELGRGSTFRLRIRCRVAVAPAALDATQALTSGPNVLAGRRVLVVDDGADNRLLLGSILRRAGAEVVEAGDGRAAVDAVVAAHGSGSPFDIVLMDVQMPVLDGLSATAELVERGLTVPVVAVSAGSLGDDRNSCFAAGCVAFVGKPIDRRVLLAETCRALASARAAVAA